MIYGNIWGILVQGVMEKLNSNQKLATFFVEGIYRGNSSISSPDKKGTPLHWAALAGHLDTVAMLIKMGADPTLVVPAYGVTAGDIAKANCHLNVYHYLKSFQDKH